MLSKDTLHVKLNKHVIFDKRLDSKKGGIMHAILRSVMQNRNVTQVDLAKGLGIAQSTFSRKLNGHTDFTLTECQIIKKMLKSKATIDELFKED